MNRCWEWVFSLAEIFTPQISHQLFPKFSSNKCTLRSSDPILLPAQLFFYVGGVVRRYCFPPAVPVSRLGRCSTTLDHWGCPLSAPDGHRLARLWRVVGSFLGPFLINAIGAARVGTATVFHSTCATPRFRVGTALHSADAWRVAGYADDWILRYFASGAVEISPFELRQAPIRVPIAVLGQATSQPPCLFFPSCWKKGGCASSPIGKRVDLSHLGHVLLASSFMMVAATPLIDLSTATNFTFSDSQKQPVLFLVSLCFVSGRASLYSRAFYAAGNPHPHGGQQPDYAASIPIYSALHRHFSTVGLAMASDLGLSQTPASHSCSIVASCPVSDCTGRSGRQDHGGGGGVVDYQVARVVL